jgi:hypothetical protein
MKTNPTKSILAVAAFIAALPITALAVRPAEPQPYSLAAISAAPEMEITPSTFFALTRSDIENQKRFIIAQNLPMTEAEAAAFWAMHRNYESDLAQLNASKFGLMERYARQYENMTDRDAHALARDLFDLEESNTALKRDYFRKFAKVMPVTKVARFFQIENQLTMALDLQLKASLPLIP